MGLSSKRDVAAAPLVMEKHTCCQVTFPPLPSPPCHPSLSPLGMLKRGEPELDEAQILMRALRDFNTPKIPAHDTPIFIRLINVRYSHLLMFL